MCDEYKIPRDVQLALEHVAMDEHALRARVRSLESDWESYRALSQQLLRAYADARREIDRARETIARLTAENRQLRGELMRRDMERVA
jgi:hypothetical protein